MAASISGTTSKPKWKILKLYSFPPSSLFPISFSLIFLFFSFLIASFSAFEDESEVSCPGKFLEILLCCRLGAANIEIAR